MISPLSTEYPTAETLILRRLANSVDEYTTLSVPADKRPLDIQLTCIDFEGDGHGARLFAHNIDNFFSKSISFC